MKNIHQFYPHVLLALSIAVITGYSIIDSTRAPTVSLFCEQGILLLLIIISIWMYRKHFTETTSQVGTLQEKLLHEQEESILQIKNEIEKMKQVKVQKINQLYHLVEFGRLSAGLFHDLMNPLTHLNLEVQGLSKLETSENKKLAEVLPKVIESSKRIERIIASARKYIKSREHLETFSVNAELTEVIETLTNKARQKDVSLLSHMPKEITLYGNPFKLHHVISNIISNAIDSYHTVPESRKPFVIRINLHEHKDSIVFSVIDTGCGITDESLEHIFDPFFTTKGDDLGSGIGLSSTRDIVEQQFGGTITVESQANRGSTFTITLPIRSPEKSA